MTLVLKSQRYLFCDNTSAINLTKYPVHHSRTKHIEIRHHFIREQVSNGVYEIEFIESEKQLKDFFTKPLAKDRFNYLRTELGIYIRYVKHYINRNCITFLLTVVKINRFIQLRIDLFFPNELLFLNLSLIFFLFFFFLLSYMICIISFELFYEKKNACKTSGNLLMDYGE